MHILLIHQVFAAVDEAGGTRHHEFAAILAAHGHQVTVITSPVSYLSGAPLAMRGEEMQGATGGWVRVIHARVHTALHKSWLDRFRFFASFMVSSLWTALRVRRTA